MKYNFKDVKNLFEEHRIWCSGKELLWFEGIWDILGKEGLTENAAEAFEDDCPPDDWYSALFCAVSLLKLFHEYYTLTAGMSFGLDGIWEEVLSFDEEGITPFAFGLVCGRAKDLLYSHNLDDAVLIRSDAMREKIVKAILKHMTAAELFFSLFAVTVDLTELVESCEEEYGESGEKDYDDSEEETGKLIETVFEPKTAGEFWSYFHENFSDIVFYAENDRTVYEAYDWISSGAYPIDLDELYNRGISD